VLVALAALTLLVACGGDDNGDGGAAGDDGGTDAQALSASLTDTECTAEGPESVPAGPLSIAVANDTDAAARFELLRVDQSATAADLLAYVEGERLSIGDGQQPSWPPPYAAVVDQIPVRALWDANLTADVTPGTYGVVCFVAPPPTALYLATTFEVR